MNGTPTNGGMDGKNKALSDAVSEQGKNSEIYSRSGGATSLKLRSINLTDILIPH